MRLMTKVLIGCAVGYTAIAGIAIAAYKGVPRTNCLDKDYYAYHQRYCEQFGYGQFYAIGDTRQQITVSYDHQAADDGGHRTDAQKYIVSQTAAQVAASGGVGPTYGWVPTSADLYTRYPMSNAMAAAPRKRTVVVTKVTRRYVED